MSWKERKKIENRNVVSLGGKVRTIVDVLFCLSCANANIKDAQETHFLLFIIFPYVAPKESEITFKCGTTNDEETKGEGAENAPRGN